MVEGKFRSGRFRRRKVKVPGGRTVTRFIERTPRQAHCAETGQALHGIPRLFRVEAKNAPKSVKRPERPYGGTLSSEAMRRKMREEAVVLSEGKKGEGALYGIGRLCLKIAGRDAGKRCVVIGPVEKGLVLIDGETRRRTCSVRHLEPLPEMLALKQGASRGDVKKAFEELGIELRDTKAKKAALRPKRVHKAKEKPEEPKAAKKAKGAKPAVKAEPKAAEPSDAEPKPVKKAEPAAKKRAAPKE